MNPEPTHDFDRDVSNARERRSNYNLTATDDRPDVIATNPMRRAGHGPAQRELTDNIGGSGNAVVICRSGNQGWDEDTYEAVGGVADEGSPELDIACLGEDRSGPDPAATIAKWALPVIAGALIYYLFIDKKRFR
jgi:hypothetical protein